MTTFFCPLCMEKIDPKVEKCPCCGYRLDTDPNQTKVYHGGYLGFVIFGAIALVIFIALYFCLIRNEPPLTEKQYQNHVTQNLSIAGQEASNLNVLFGQLESDPALRTDEVWLARLATVQKRALNASQQLGTIQPSLVPTRFWTLNEEYQLLATAAKLDVQLKVSCYYRQNQVACEQINRNKEILAALFDLILVESERLELTETPPQLIF